MRGSAIALVTDLIRKRTACMRWARKPTKIFEAKLKDENLEHKGTGNTVIRALQCCISFFRIEL